MTGLRRNSSKMLLIRAVQAVRTYWVFVILYGLATEHAEGWWLTLAAVLFWYYTYTRVYFVLWDWATTRYACTPEEIRVRTGLFSQESTTVAWSDVASLHVSQPVLHRMVGCALVTVGIGAGHKRALRLDALPVEEAERMAAWYSAVTRDPVRLPEGRAVAPPRGSIAATGTTAPVDGEDVVYRVSGRDYVLISLTYGKFVLFLPFLVGAYNQVAQWFSWPEWAAVVDGGLRAGTGMVLGAGLGLVVVALLYGLGVAWVKYRGLQVGVRNGGLSAAGGLLSRERRWIRQEDMAGLRIDQNLLMRLAGHGRLSFVSRESGGESGTNTIFPSMRRTTMDLLIQRHLPRYAARGTDGRTCSGYGLVVLALHLLVMAGTVTTAVLLRDDRVSWAVAVSMVVQLAVLHRRWAAVELLEQGTALEFRRGFLWTRQYRVPTSVVQVVQRVQGPLARVFGVVDMSLFIHDNGAVRLRVPDCPRAVADAVAEAIRREAVPGSAVCPAPSPDRQPAEYASGSHSCPSARALSS